MREAVLIRPFASHKAREQLIHRALIESQGAISQRLQGKFVNTKLTVWTGALCDPDDLAGPPGDHRHSFVTGCEFSKNGHLLCRGAR